MIEFSKILKNNLIFSEVKVNKRRPFKRKELKIEIFKRIQIKLRESEYDYHTKSRKEKESMNNKRETIS